MAVYEQMFHTKQPQCRLLLLVPRCLVNGVNMRLKKINHQTTPELPTKVIELEIMPDQVHRLVGVDP